MAILDKLKKLTNQLLPTGRAFKMPYGGELQRLRDGLAQSETRLHDDAVSILKSAIPDNDDFSVDDARFWERVLGLITNEAVSLANRKLAIQRKMAHPGDIPARQYYLFMERELQAAGFDVRVHENLGRVNPAVFSSQGFQHGDIQHGDVQHGGNNVDRIANSLDADEDASFIVVNNWSNCFFIGGTYVGDFADVESARKTEFRQLILRLKPLNQVGFLLITYV